MGNLKADAPELYSAIAVDAKRLLLELLSTVCRRDVGINTPILWIFNPEHAQLSLGFGINWMHFGGRVRNA